MNLHGIVSGAIAVVNPFTPVTIKLSNGWTSNPDGTRTPAYIEVDGISAQVQALSFRDIQQIAGLNLEGTRKAMYLNGEIDGLVRATNNGGDLVIFPNGSVWLVAMILEQWPDWCKAAVTLQNNA
jgi:hypothetical protein